MRKVFIWSILFLVFSVLPAWATSTGLNNIPTADVVPYNVLVFQYFGDFGNDNVPDHFAGFKYGLAKNIEIGLDGRFYAEKSLNEWLVAQGKIRFDLASDLAVAVGITNVGDRARAGNESPFGVLSYDMGFLRVHFGGALQNDNEGFFGGLDKTFTLLDRDFMLRSDLIQANDQDDTVVSVGFIYDLGSNFLIESWVSFPSETGKEDVATIKLNYVIKF